MSIKKILMSAMLLSSVPVCYALAQEGPALFKQVDEQPAAAQPAAQPAPAAAQPAAAQPAAQPAPAAAQPAAAKPAAPAPAVQDDKALSNVPATSYWGVRGLSQTLSAEALGKNRLNFAALGSYFELTKRTNPRVTGNVVLARGAISYGVNEFVDIFGVLPMNYFSPDKDASKFRVGELMGGGQVSLSQLFWPEFKLVQMAFHTHGIYLFKDKDTRFTQTGCAYDGYEYFDTRGDGDRSSGLGLDLVPKLAVSIAAGNKFTVKLHGNIGAAMSAGSSGEPLLLSSVGLQVDPAEFLTIGVEFNSRTMFDQPTIRDPLWLTPSLMYRSPYWGSFGFGVLAGTDICVSSDSKNSKARKGMKPLEKWRAFGDIVVSIDGDAPRRKAEAGKAQAEAEEKAGLAKEAVRLAAEKDSLARKATEDSTRAAEEMARRAEADSLRTKAIADSLAGVVQAVSQKAKADSIAQAEATTELLAKAEQKRVADSLTLAETQKKLAEERAKRSQAEQYLLTTGMLVLESVYFTSGKTEIHINSKPYLGTIAKMLVKYPKLRVEIGGHTDNIGRFETNMNLSQKRSEAVFLHMVSIESGLAQMLSARGYGSTVPKADNATAGGREINRRVELKVLNPEVLKEYNP